MSIKKIIIISFLLLTILTIGVVSADENIASDNLKVSDDANITITESYDSDEHEIDVNDDEIIIDENDEDYDDEEIIASITLPDNTNKGSFQVLNGEEVVARLDVSNDNDHWDKYDGILDGTIFLNDFDLTKVKNNDELSFQFFEVIGGNPVDFFTKVYKVSLTDSTMKLSQIHKGMTEDDVYIQVNNTNITKPDENFTHVYVTQKDGLFIITASGDDDFEIFREDLSTTERPYVKVKNDKGEYYRFTFSFTDLNNFIAQNFTGADSFIDLVNKQFFSSGDDIYFELYERDGRDEIYSKIMTFNLTMDGLISFYEENDDVDVIYNDLCIIMSEGWQEQEIIEYIVNKEINGEIVIYLNNNTTPAFKKSLLDLSPVDLDEDEDYNHYIITVSDLNVTNPGKYIIRDYFYDNNGNKLYQYDIEDPEILELYEPQSVDVNNVTIEVNPMPTSIESNESLIIIDSSANADDDIVIYVDGNKQPTTIKLKDCVKDENQNYVIKSKQLNLGIGKHTLNITYNGRNLTANVELFTNLIINLPEQNETIYTTFNEIFVFISCDDDEIYSNITGNINLTIIDNNETKYTLEKDIWDLNYNQDLSSFIISTKDIETELNGTYNVIVKYFDEYGGITQTESNITFKSFDPKDYGTLIKNIYKDKNDSLITFNDIPRNHTIFFEIDANKTIELNKIDLRFNPENKTYYIKYDEIKELTDGYHSIKVYINPDTGRIDLSSGEVLVDLQENIDPSLTINITNIEEGQIANVTITTNSTFTGNILLQVANINYTVDIVKGQGNLTITNLTAGTYNATALFKSDAIFMDSNKTTTFNVTSKPTQTQPPAEVIKLTLKKVKIKKSAKKLVLKATLKINGKGKKGLKVIFKFKNKKYIAKTNKKGIAKVTIKKKILKKLKVGKKIKYQASYKNTVKKVSVKVKK